MLRKEDFVYYGKFLKPHGTKGEIGLEGDSILLGEECDFVACDIDGILVPFFFETRRTKNSDTLIVKIERMESAEEVRFLTNREAYIPREWTEDSEALSWSFFRGFIAVDENLGELGEITDIDESTINTLFVIDNDGEEILVPAQEEFIIGIDQENREILFNLPEGLVTL
ncbi:MAG: 16S rRNA processing protein RimM [Bacteroidaceae bacterium]|nr:16S rRNA processing protein RimM [Bacteroidales bacterium]MBQ8695883.1 16S rRNA processing protein RimM [Bacteroidaceae bacterium]MBR3615732.1 16S rRNA processing protein RimM [Bacteroidaceae bacterium]